jgi:hypothetical protein
MWRSFICALRPAPRAPARHPREFRDHAEEVRTPWPDTPSIKIPNTRLVFFIPLITERAEKL